ncbi:3-(3-hydroxydecanoyloxy)decanoate synthase [Frankliniella fusca]|uniref:3-(3-hydroxydecanoyloxy)decanoate synthase n=1 Tax=Frankliniella fusca TaxID=407009 RepID=A0AAE1LEW4_9NEOP|nr:3-(3-hydroxydecanoyloxy)decanoate synthase [Frankliniella fusca]KAK3920960.1 3-(3-hydroxydecanoyloxy)decanoate synthase [Frankliniella fusca]
MGPQALSLDLRVTLVYHWDLVYTIATLSVSRDHKYVRRTSSTFFGPGLHLGLLVYFGNLQYISLSLRSVLGVFRSKDERPNHPCSSRTSATVLEKCIFFWDGA